MGGPIGEARIRLPARITRGDIITVSAIVTHPMDTGFFRDKDGNPIPPYFIREVKVDYAGRQVARFTWTSGISRDPFVSFSLRASQEGPLTMTWIDSKDDTFTQTANVTFTSA